MMRQVTLKAIQVNHQQCGFTLIELMTVVLIIGVLAALAYPQYTRHQIQARRTDAQSTLLQNAGMLQKYYTACGQYPLTLAAGGAAAPCTTGLGVPPTSMDGHYTLLYAPAAFNGIANQTYTLTAMPAAGSPQVNDTECTSLGINDAGRKQSTGAVPVERCWRQ